jgi:hypothetical protein
LPIIPFSLRLNQSKLLKYKASRKEGERHLSNGPNYNKLGKLVFKRVHIGYDDGFKKLGGVSWSGSQSFNE